MTAGDRRATTVRSAASVLVLFAVAGPLAACSRAPAPALPHAESDPVGTAATGRQGSTAPGARRSPSAQAYLTCMRDHGVPMLDALTTEGMPQVDKTRADVDAVGAAEEACNGLRPVVDAAALPDPADVEKLRRYAVCVRAHGISDFPDPDPRTGTLPDLTPDLAAEVKQKLPAADEACRALVPVDHGQVGG